MSKKTENRKYIEEIVRLYLFILVGRIALES